MTNEQDGRSSLTAEGTGSVHDTVDEQGGAEPDQ